LEKDISEFEALKINSLSRAASFSRFVTSLTLGPNSSYKQKDEAETIRVTIPCKENVHPQQRQRRIVKVTTNAPITSSDLRVLQSNVQRKSEERRMASAIRKKLEVKMTEEHQEFEKINAKLKQMKIQAEEKHCTKMQTLQRQMEDALKQEEQEEKIYQQQRSQLLLNTKSIIDQQEKEFNESLKRFGDHFKTMEGKFNLIVQKCPAELAPVVENYKKNIASIKAQLEANRRSMEVLKNATNSLETICVSLIQQINEFDEKLKAQQKLQEQQDQLLLQQQKEAEQQQQRAAPLLPTPQALPIEPVPQEVQQQQHHQSMPAIQSEKANQFNQLMHLYNEKVDSTRQLNAESALQQYRFALKFAINNPINLLNEKDKSTLVEGFRKLDSMLTGAMVQTPKGQISINNHPEANTWSKLRIAEKLIDRCDKQPEIAFYAAALVIALWQKYPDFGEIFLARLYKECPFLFPQMPKKLNNQTNEEYLQSWGYRLNENNVAESYSLYQGRTSKFALLMCAVWITFPKSLPHPFGIEFGWKYLCNVLNTPPDTVYLHLLDRVLGVAGAAMHQTYGSQFVKLMFLMRDHYLTKLQSQRNQLDEESIAIFDRLRDSVASFFKEGRFAEPKGRLPMNYW